MFQSRPEVSQVSVPVDLGVKELKAELERILGSQSFSQSPVLKNLLVFLVEQTAAGKTNDLKEYSIATTVLGRQETFDPALDSIVRVHARRLRDRLASYYETEGHNSQVKIEIPKRQYGVILTRRLISFETERTQTASTVTIGNLPTPRTSLLGRSEILTKLASKLQRPEVRLLTLTGPGGTGKTRLAIELAANQSPQYRGGTFFIGLAGIRTSRHIQSELLEALTARRISGGVAGDFLGRMRERIQEPLLMVLDNFEHLMDGAPIVGSILEACASLTVIVTSRSPLHVYGEYVSAVSPLPLPGTDELLSIGELRLNPAVQLFQQRAEAANGDFSVDEHNADDVLSICKRLDGLPLAIELAAARTSTLPTSELRLRLDNWLDLLADGPRDMPPRQRALRATIDWSFELLQPHEQRFLQRVSVMPGGFDHDGAEVVANAWRDLDGQIEATISALVSHSMLQHHNDSNGGSRFSMLETVREYCLEKLEATGQAELARKAMAAYALVIAEEEDDRHGIVSGERRVEWIRLCQAEDANWRASMEWVLKTQNTAWAMRLATGLYAMWEFRDRIEEGCAMMQAVLQLPGAGEPSLPRAQLLRALSMLTNQLDASKAAPYFQETAELCRQLGEPAGIRDALLALGINAATLGDHEAATRYFEEAVTVCRNMGGDPGPHGAALSNLAISVNALKQHDRALALLEKAQQVFESVAGTAWSWSVMGDVERSRNRYRVAREMYQHAIDEYSSIDDALGVGRTLLELGRIHRLEDDPHGALEKLCQASVLFSSVQDHWGTIEGLELLVAVVIQLGKPELAVVVSGAVAALRQRAHTSRFADASPDLESSLTIARKSLDPTHANQLWNRGYQMSTGQILTFVQGELDIPIAKTAETLPGR